MKRMPSSKLSRSTTTSAAEPSLITSQPRDFLVKEGERASFEVSVSREVSRYASYQWYFKDALLPDANTKRLVINRAQRTNVGLYTCMVTVDIPNDQEQPQYILSQPTQLMLFTKGSIIVYGTPIPGGGGSGTCPGPYVGYVNFKKTSAPYGWCLVNPAVPGTARDPQSTQTVVRYFGAPLANNGCGGGSQGVTVPAGTCAYRFTIYFRSGPVPAGPYAIELTGFNP